MWSPIFASQHSILVNTIQIISSFSYMLENVLLGSIVAVGNVTEGCTAVIVW
jgi:hypothetical protein